MEEKKIEVGAMDILKKEEYGSIFIVIIIFLVGWFSVLSHTLWVKVVGWIVLGFVLITCYKISQVLKERVKERKEDKIEKEVK